MKYSWWSILDWNPYVLNISDHTVFHQWNISDLISSVVFSSILDPEGDDDDEIGPKLDEAVQGDNSEGREPVKQEAPIKKEPVLLTRDENLRSHSTQREWDKGKESKK